MPRQIKEEYEIVGEIGAGGMATVYKAVQKSLDRPVAIKELKKSYQADGQIVRRFERESRVAASLQHENIVHIYDYWKKPSYSIVMEYVDGVNLADVLEKTGALPVDVGVMIAIQACNALEYAHMRGLVHRDIKPSNIMIKRNGEVKLMDFGIAQSRNLEALTVPGMLIGTPSYMSPEQIMGQQLDARSDIFSFGIVLYEMFTGVKPFIESDARSVTARILKDKFASPRGINKGIPWRLQWLIKKCLRKKPKRRYRSMLEVEMRLGKRVAGRTTKAASLLRIADYLVSMNIIDPAPDHESMVITSKISQAARYRKVLLAAFAAVIVVSAAAVYVYRTNLAELFPQTTPLSQAPQTTSPSLATKPQGSAIPGLPPSGVKQDVVAAPTATTQSTQPATSSTPTRHPR